jgi:hypothetical protein
MKDLENELRAALRRREPPAGFTERVQAQIEAAPAPKAGWRRALASLFGIPPLRWVAAGAAACLLLAIGIAHYREVQRQRAEGEAAKVQVMQALRIASSKLNVTMKRVQEPDRRPPRT